MEKINADPDQVEQINADPEQVEQINADPEQVEQKQCGSGTSRANQCGFGSSRVNQCGSLRIRIQIQNTALENRYKPVSLSAPIGLCIQALQCSAPLISYTQLGLNWKRFFGGEFVQHLKS